MKQREIEKITEILEKKSKKYCKKRKRFLRKKQRKELKEECARKFMHLYFECKGWSFEND